MRKTLVFCLLICITHGGQSQSILKGQGSAVHDYIKIYQRYISNHKIAHCPMYPTCSQYGLMVFSDHSFPIAMAMTADRISRCGNHLEQYSKIENGTYSNRWLDYPPDRVVPDSLLVKRPPLCVAEEIITSTDSTAKAIQFTNQLINQHSYTSALLEIDRLLYYDTSLRHKPNLYLNKLKCFESLRQYSEGLLLYEQQMPSEVKANYKIKYATAHLYDLAGNYAKSLSLFQEAAMLWDSNEVAPYGELALLYARESLFDKAKTALERKCDIDGDWYSFTTNCSIIDGLERMPQKNPTIAMLLGIIPGAGYIYVNQPLNALSSILINGMLAYALYTSIQTQNYGLGIIIGVLNFSFYSGNIIGSGTSAKRHNEMIKRDAMTELRNNIHFIY